MRRLAKTQRVTALSLAKLRSICKKVDIRDCLHPTLAKKVVLAKRSKRVYAPLTGDNVCQTFMHCSGSQLLSQAKAAGLTPPQVREPLLKDEGCVAKIVNELEGELL